eukprot:PhF_6_TR3430/c0_g1_i2/m.4997
MSNNTTTAPADNVTSPSPPKARSATPQGNNTVKVTVPKVPISKATNPLGGHNNNNIAHTLPHRKGAAAAPTSAGHHPSHSKQAPVIVVTSRKQHITVDDLVHSREAHLTVLARKARENELRKYRESRLRAADQRRQQTVRGEYWIGVLQQEFCTALPAELTGASPKGRGVNGNLKKESYAYTRSKTCYSGTDSHTTAAAHVVVPSALHHPGAKMEPLMNSEPSMESTIKSLNSTQNGVGYDVRRSQS